MPLHFPPTADAQNTLDRPYPGGFECFVLDEDGEADVADLEAYRAIEEAAARLFKQDDPTSQRGCIEYLRDCDRFLRDHGETANTDILPDLLARSDHLLRQAGTAADAALSAAAVHEARSMVCSLALRAGPPGLITIGSYITRPGNVVEMKNIMMNDDHQQAAAAKRISMSDPDAMARMSALYDVYMQRTSGGPWHHPCPAPEAFIDAARQGRPFDEVRRQMLPPPYLRGLRA